MSPANIYIYMELLVNRDNKEVMGISLKSYMPHDTGRCNITGHVRNASFRCLQSYCTKEAKGTPQFWEGASEYCHCETIQGKINIRAQDLWMV